MRLVVQGQHMHRKDEQGRGDFENAFSPVPHASGFRMILALATQNNMHCDHVDISQAFVQGRSIVLLLFLQKQNLATAIYLFGLGTLLTGLGLKHMRIRSHHDLAGALVTSLLLGRPWWSTTSPTCLPLSVFTITSDQHRCRIPPLL